MVNRGVTDLCHGLIDRLLPVLIGGDDLLRRRRRVRAESIFAGRRLRYIRVYNVVWGQGLLRRTCSLWCVLGGDVELLDDTWPWGFLR